MKNIPKCPQCKKDLFFELGTHNVDSDTCECLDAINKFKIYLNHIINDVDPDIHNRLWNQLFDIIKENNKK